MKDFEKIEAIARAASGAIGREPCFTFPGVLDVIRLCTLNGIAVLGSECLQVRSDGYATKGLSGYHLTMGSGPRQSEGWSEYVMANNQLAEEFVRGNPTGDDHVYLLTTASWSEFCKMKGS